MLTTLYEEFVSIFGSYHPIEVTTYNGIEYCVDFGFIMCLAFCIVLLYGVLRICGAIVSAVFRS